VTLTAALIQASAGLLAEDAIIPAQQVLALAAQPLIAAGELQTDAVLPGALQDQMLTAALIQASAGLQEKDVIAPVVMVLEAALPPQTATPLQTDVVQQTVREGVMLTAVQMQAIAGLQAEAVIAAAAQVLDPAQPAPIAAARQQMAAALNGALTELMQTAAQTVGAIGLIYPHNPLIV
jgi:hypothetical protein